MRAGQSWHAQDTRPAGALEHLEHVPHCDARVEPLARDTVASR